jgi:RNA polymerase-binding transcription factor DksA
MNEMVDETLHHLGDEGGVSADRDYEGYEEELSLATNERNLWEEVKAALERIDAGTYGRCEDCGAAIANSRLNVLPETRWCAYCAGSHAAMPVD